MKSRDRAQSGKRGVRQRRGTPAQQRTQGNLSKTSPGWGRLSEEPRVEWWRRAKGIRIRLRNRRTRLLRGQDLYNKVNTVQALLGRPPHEWPPPQPKFGLNPVAGFVISNDGGGLALKLRLRAPPTQEIMVYGSKPRKAGQYSPGPFRYLALLPAPAGEESDITEQYVRAHGVPPDNSRVFIRVRPEENGWESRGQTAIFQALVPAKGGGAGGEMGPEQE